MTDLALLRTYGFRGESLASILQQSSKIVIHTRPAGWVPFEKVLYPGGHTSIREKPDAIIGHLRGYGTKILVDGFLSNTPDQRKALDFKFELDRVIQLLEAYSIAHHRVEIILKYFDGDVITKFPSADSSEKRFLQVCGSELSPKDLFEVHYRSEDKKWQVNGWIGTKDSPKLKAQYMFLNNLPLGGKNLFEKLLARCAKKVPFIKRHSPLPSWYCLFITCPRNLYTVRVREQRKVPIFDKSESEDRAAREFKSSLKQFLVHQSGGVVISQESSSPQRPVTTMPAQPSCSDGPYGQNISVSRLIGPGICLVTSKKKQFPVADILRSSTHESGRESEEQVEVISTEKLSKSFSFSHGSKQTAKRSHDSPSFRDDAKAARLQGHQPLPRGFLGQTSTTTTSPERKSLPAHISEAHRLSSKNSEEILRDIRIVQNQLESAFQRLQKVEACLGVSSPRTKTRESLRKLAAQEENSSSGTASGSLLDKK